MSEQEQKGIVLPVDKLSYSSFTQLLRNPLIFKLKHILKVYTGKVGVSGMVGRAGHEALKTYYGGNPDMPVSNDRELARQEAVAWGLKYLEEYSDIYIEYGKTGSREKMLKSYTQAMKFYFAEEPEYNDILIVEKKIESVMKTVDGDMLPLPAVGVPDIVDKRKDGGIDVVDVKFVKSFTNYETEDWIKILQSQFLWHLLRGAMNITADRMLFREVKVTENEMDKNTGKVAPQIRDYVIPFSHEQYRVIFYNLYKDVVKFLSNPDAIYLPNLSDPFDGEQAGLLYAQGLLNSDMSDVEVMHKVKDVAFVSKKFLSSKLDRVENAHLLPEEKIKIRLAEFGIPVEPVEKKVGSSITQYRFKVSAGIRMSTIEKHKADIALAVEAKGDIRIIAPIPGTSLIGVEVPNETRTIVTMDKKELVKYSMLLPIGVDVHGNVIKKALNEMPHLLIAGTTGSGKSILLHTIISALTKQMPAENMSMILIDPKRVELLTFSKIKHLKGGKIIYKYQEAIIALTAAVNEMEKRYALLEKEKCRDIHEYNLIKIRLPYIVIVIDEFADLMLQGKVEDKKRKQKDSIDHAARRAQAEVMARQMAKMGLTYKPTMTEDADSSAEDLIVRLAQMARAVGIHLIIATQRPSVDVITGLIKANFPTRIALTTSSAIDSKIILGEDGAEKLNGKGDMIFMSPGMPKTRLQGFMIDTK